MKHTLRDECAYCCKIRAQGMARQVRRGVCQPSEGQELITAQKGLKQLGRILDFSALCCIATSHDFIKNSFQQLFEVQVPEARQLHRNCHLKKKNLAVIIMGTTLEV